MSGSIAWTAAAVVVVLVAWWSIPKGTDDRLLYPGLLRRLARGVRARAVWFALWLIAWPHVVDILLRTKRMPVATTPKDEVWRDEGNDRTVLWRYARTTPPTRREPVLLVHSLVTQPWILDLLPGRSLVEALLAEGFDVYLLDWGDVGWRQASRGLDDYLDALRTAEQRVLDASGARRLHVVGYCLGATVALLRLATEAHSAVASFAAVAPPVDLSVPGGFRSTLGSRSLRPVLVLDGTSCVPAALIRESFHFLRPMALRTVWHRLRTRGDRSQARYHAAMARWTWEHRKLPGALFFDLVGLYRANAPAALLDRLTVPTLLAVAAHDHIVPWASSAALATAPHAAVASVVCESGHVSMLVGAEGRRTLWPALADWLARPRRSRSNVRSLH
jgi:polyhydroxyalkanoate synthase